MKRSTKKGTKKKAPTRKPTPRRARAKKAADSKTPPRGARQKPKQASPAEGADLGGRPTKYRPEYAEIARRMCRLGATDAQLAEAFDVVTSTIWLWQSKHQGFSNALIAGKAEFDDRVVRALAQRAVGYSYDAVRIMQHEGRPIMVPYVEHCPPDVNACRLWLFNRRPEEWREKIEVGGKDGAAIPVEISPENATDFARRMFLIMSLGTRALKGEGP